MLSSASRLRALYLNVGAGGAVAGLTQAGFDAQLAVEPDRHAAATLRRVGLPAVRHEDLSTCPTNLFAPGALDLLYGRNTQGPLDAGDHVPVLLEHVDAQRPRAFVLETDASVFDDRHKDYRDMVRGSLDGLGYPTTHWTVYDARDYGAPSPWCAAFLVALRDEQASFERPLPTPEALTPSTLSSVLDTSMRLRFRGHVGARGERACQRWRERAETSSVPRLVDVLDADEAEDVPYPDEVKAWRACGINILGLADDVKNAQASLLGPDGPYLTVEQAALLRGFPEGYPFEGSSRTVYRQILHSTAPAVARALGRAVAEALERAEESAPGIELFPLSPTPEPTSAKSSALGRYDLVRAKARGDRKDYRLDRLPMEEGGQAQVFRAVHKETDTEVAFKRRSSKRETAVARMRREIEVSHLLGQQTHYMPILDSSPQDGWLVMPMAQATAEGWHDDLRDPASLRGLVEALMDVLEIAHTHDWLHRDVKPSNILLLDGQWTLADWGIVRRPRGQTTKAGRTRFEIGTEGFAAPELFVAAHEATPAADIYGIGRVIAWALTGKYPQTNVQLLPDPGPWRNITRVATHADPKRRPQSVEELRELINRELTEPADLPTDRAKRLWEEARAGDPAAVTPLLELIADHPEDYELYLHTLMGLSAEQAGPWLSLNPQGRDRLLKAMAEHAYSQGARRVQLGEAARVVIWLHALAEFSAAKDDWDLLDEAVRAMCAWDAAWDQWNAQGQIESWLRSLSGKSAQLVAAVLRDYPRSARHFSDLARDGTVDLWIRQAIREAAGTP
ncbi:DNA cytosine methyltransferase [Streptomyces sp. Root369]|uniref:protein kinase domain-containing protein n=1 Tax=Streptomyces sp. Root369 TaxID=1736523 RepID=UPI00099EF5F5|nr:DNA cytosine methyltransferase [Streptomyces sp. Root369]